MGHWEYWQQATLRHSSCHSSGLARSHRFAHTSLHWISDLACFTWRYEEAEASITSLRAINLGLIAREFAHLKVAVEEDRVLRADKSRIWSIFKKENLKRTTTAGALLPLYQVSEVALTNTFSTVILVQSGVSDPFRMTVVINCLAFAGVIISPTLFDTVGRRPVALTGSVIMMLLDFAAGGLACAGLKTQNETLALAGIVVFTFFANACFKPL